MRCRFPFRTRREYQLLSTKLSEALPHFGNEQLGLLKRSEVAALGNLVPVEELRIGLIGPHFRRYEKVALEDTHRNRQFEGHSGEILCETFVIEPCRGCRGVSQPVESDIVQHTVDRDRLRRIALVVAPSLTLLVHPPCF